MGIAGKTDLLRQSDFRRLLNCVQECYAIRGPETLEQFLHVLFNSLSRSTPTERMTYNHMNPETPAT